MTTIRDVAKAAGVSIATVSAVINDSAFVSADLKARVLGAIADLRYAPSQVARNLKRGRTQLIALAVAISLRCDGCITVHAEEARKQGASKDEIAEALGVAITVNAGAALVYSTRTLDAFTAATEAAAGQ